MNRRQYERELTDDEDGFGLQEREKKLYAHADPDEFEVDETLEQRRIFERHRIDLAKWFLGKDGGYTIREFKQIMKTEMEENPQRYTIRDPSTSKSD